MEKFSIVAALQLELDNSIDSVITQVKDRLKGAAAITLSTKGINARIGEIKEKLKASKVLLPIGLAGGTNTQIATKLNARLKNIASATDSPFVYLKTAVDLTSEENVRKHVKQLSTTLSGSSSKNPILLSVGVNPISEERVNTQIKQLKKSMSGATNMIGGEIKSPQKVVQVPIKNIDINEEAVISNLKRKIANINASLSDSVIKISVKVDQETNAEISKIVTLLSKIQSKTIRINLGTRESTINKIGLLSKQFDLLNVSVKSLNLPKLITTSDVLSHLGSSLKFLSRVSGKTFNFGFSIKDVNILDKINNSARAISNGFNLATASATRFQSVMQQLVTIGQQFNSVGKQFKSNTLPKVGGVPNVANPSSQAASNQKAVTSSVQQTTSAMQALGEQSAITFKRFGAYTLVTAGFFRLTFAIQNALVEFKDFELNLNKIRQVTKESYSTTQLLGDEISRLAVKYGVSSKSISETTLVLAQAGLTISQTKEALEALTLSELAPTFDDITNTVEGSIAAMSQFDLKTSDLTKTLSQINSVSAAFAIESSDLTTAIQKAGGSFAAAGGTIEELFALFTSVRASTRESADTIATGFRTIFARLQRLRTSEFLSEFGVDLRKTSEDVDKLGGSLGDFVGPFEAIRRLSDAMSNIPSGGLDSRFAQIGEELGGFRQINKVLPLLKNFAVATDAYGVAMNRTDSLMRDAEIAQETYSNSLTKLREEFLLLVREFAENKDIKLLINSMIDLARVTLQAAKAFKDLVVPVAPILTLAAIAPTKDLLRGFSTKFSEFSHKNSGGWIPGDGSKDTVPAMLTKGEYVLRKRAVQKIGVENLDYLNRANFNFGGSVGTKLSYGAAGLAGYTFIESGALKSLTEMDNVFKDATLAIIGFVTSLNLLKRVVPSLTEGMKAAQEKPDPYRNQYSAFKPNVNAPGFTPLGKNSNAAIGFAAASLQSSSLTNNRALSALTESNINHIASNTAKRKQNVALATQLNNNPAMLEKSRARYIRAMNAEQERLINLDRSSKVALDPRSHLGKQYAKQGLTSAYQVQDLVGSATGANVTRSFKTKKEATQFSRNNFRQYLSSLSSSQRVSELSKRSGVFASAASNYLNSNLRFASSSQNLQSQIGQNTRGIQSGNAAIRSNYIRTSSIKPNLALANQVGSMEGHNAYIDRQRSTMRMRNYLNIRNNMNPGPPFIPPFIRGIAGKLSNISFDEEKINKASIGVGAAGIASSLIGGTLEKENQRRIANGNGNIELARSAGAFSGAGTGVLAGAAIGSIFGPQGMVIGGVLGGMTGAIKGFINGGKEFEAAIARMNISKVGSELEKVFQSIKDGQSTSRTQSTSFLKNISEVRTTLQSSSDPEVRQDAKALLTNNSLNILEFVKSLAESSSTIENFNQKVDEVSQRFIAGVLGKSFSQFKDMIDKTIKSGNLLVLSQRILAQATLDFDNQVRSILRFNAAFDEASRSGKTRTNTLSSFVEGGSGDLPISSKLAESVKNASNSSDISGITSRIQSFGSQFGAYGNTLADTVKSFVQAENILPEVLLKLKSKDPLGETDVATSLEKELKDRGFSRNIINLIQARFESLVGDDLKDSSFYKNLEKDLGKAVKDLLEGGSPAIEAFANAASKSAEILQGYSDALLKVIAVDQKISDGKSSINSLQRDSIIAQDTLLGRNPNFNALLNNSEANQRIFTGGKTSSQLFNRIGLAQNNITDINQKIASTEDNDLRSRLIQEKNKEISALTQARIGLEYLAKDTRILSDLQNKLAQSQQERLRVEDFQNSFIFGSNEDRREQKKIVGFSQDVINAGGDLSVVPEKYRKNLLSFFQEFGNQTVPGLNITGKDAINKIRAASGFDPSQPSDAENLLGAQIQAEFSKMIDAQNQLNKILESDRLKLSESIGRDFKNMMDSLNRSINQSFVRDLDTQIGSTSTERNTLDAQLQKLTSVNSRFGENAIVNAPLIKQNADLLQKAGARLGGANSVLTTIDNAYTKAGSTGQDAFDSLGKQGEFSRQKINIQDFNDTFNQYTKGVNQDTKDALLEIIGQSDIGLKDGKFSLGSFLTALKSAAESLKSQSDKDNQSALIDRNRLIGNVGQDNFGKILKDVQNKNSELITLSNTFPKDASIKELNSKIQELNEKITQLTSTRDKTIASKFASGGFVPGVGNTDSVNARLMPGEFVMRKAAVQKYGVGFMKNINGGVQKFANGGLVQSNSVSIDSVSISKLNMAINQFAVQVEHMKDAFSVLPSEIQMVGKHTLDINLNGSTVLQNIMPEVKNLIINEIKTSINRLISKKFPQVGHFE